MQRGTRDFEDFDGPVKPEGKTVRIEVDENGKVKDAIGYIIGIKKGEPLKEYVEKWFFRLPEGPVSKGSTWTRNIPEDDPAGGQGEAEGSDNENAAPGGQEGSPEDAGKSDSHMEGTIEYVLEKFEKKDGIVVALIKYEAELEARQMMEGVLTESEIKSKGKAKIAVDGGYVVESELSVEVKGDVIQIDDFTGKETREGFVQVMHTELKLEK